MKSIVRIALFFAALVVSVPAVASAQLIEPFRFTAPFAFEVGHQLLPAGTYVLSPTAGIQGGNELTLSNTAKPLLFLVGNNLGANPDPKGLSSEIVFAFNQETGHYVMCEVWDSSDQSGVQVNGTYALTKSHSKIK